MTELRILTVRQPWASHIIEGTKDIENRSGDIVGSFRGPTALHAAKAIDPTEDWCDEAYYPLGVILGIVDLVGVHYSSRCFHLRRDIGRYCSPLSDPNCFHLVLANPRPLATPIPWRGRLGLTRIDTSMPGLEALEGLL